MHKYVDRKLDSLTLFLFRYGYTSNVYGSLPRSVLKSTVDSYEMLDVVPFTIFQRIDDEADISSKLAKLLYAGFFYQLILTRVSFQRDFRTKTDFGFVRQRGYPHERFKHFIAQKMKRPNGFAALNGTSLYVLFLDGTYTVNVHER